MQLHTVDFFPPVLDDPEAYGAVAAANSLSDVYACGGEPRVVLNLAGFPADWGPEILEPVFAGAVAKVAEAGALWVGGHTMRSQEPFFGFAVYGEVAEEHLVTNQGARPGDHLFLTKPLGSGPVTTAIKRGLATPAQADRVAAGMARLNRTAAAAMRAAGVRAGTDVTGFGLLGHAANLARASQVTLELRAVGLPLYPGAGEFAAGGILSGGAARGRRSLAEFVLVEPSVPPWLADLCFDAETSGGILAAVPEAAQAAFEAAFPEGEEPALVGEVQGGEPGVLLC